MRMVINLILGVLVLALPAGVFANEMTICITEVPLESVKTGFDDLGHGQTADLILGTAQKAGLKVNFKWTPLKRSIQYFLEDKVDFLVGFPGFLAPFQADIKTTGFTPVLRMFIYLHYYKPSHPGGIRFSTVDDLKPYTIALQRGAPNMAMYKKAGIKIHEFNRFSAIFGMLKLGRVDIVECSELAGRYIPIKHFPDETENFVKLEKPIQGAEFGILYKMANKRAVDLDKQFQIGLKRFKESGDYLRIFQRYWGEDVPAHNLLD